MTTRVKVPARGPIPARIMLVGEAPGATEEAEGRPFVGGSGVELTKMLHEAGIVRGECFITNVCKYRPPGNQVENFFEGKKHDKPNELILEGLAELRAEIAEVKPELILAFGNTALWALTGHWGITDWRGSILRERESNAFVVPTFHPAGVLRNWDWRPLVVLDLKRARRVLAGEITEPKYNFITAPDSNTALTWLYAHIFQAETMRTSGKGALHLSVDIETRNRQIACVGIARSATEAICIPFMDVNKPDGNYWPEHQEEMIVKALRQLLHHPNVRVSGQNFVYDLQYLIKQWACYPKLWRDTMIVHHTCFPGIPKGLDFLSSFYLDWHVYWKHEGKLWDPHETPEETLWIYNCKDAVITWEIAELQSRVIEQIGFAAGEHPAPPDIQMSLVPLVLETMLRGVRIDTELKRQLILDLDEEIAKRQASINFIVGREINCRSPKQLQALFYDELHQPVIRNYKTKRPTTDEDALIKIAAREPLLGPLIKRINEVRKLSVAQSFCAQNLELDKRMRCSYNVAGTETFRFSSSEDAFGFGTNLQNITKGEEDGEFRIPNLRRLFTPDRGYTLGEFDLKAADAQVVAAEADEWELLSLLKPGGDYDLHSVNAARWGLPRQTCKSAVHGTNYGASPHALVANLGIDRDVAEAVQLDWLTRFPGIRQWHDRILRQLMLHRFVQNKFGYRRLYFNRIDDLLKEALAWIPQSTVAIATNLGALQIKRQFPFVQFLLQTHDSVTLQWPSDRTEELVPQLKEAMKVRIPYSLPLTIEVDCKISSKSWGEVE